MVDNGWSTDSNDGCLRPLCEYAGDLSQPTRTRGTYEDDPNDPWGIRRGDGKTPDSQHARCGLLSKWTESRHGWSRRGCSDVERGANSTLPGVNSHGALSSVHFSEDGSILMAASVDGVVTLWDRWKGQVLREVRDLPKGLRATISPDGTHAAWAGWSGTLHIHSFPSTRRQVSVQAHLRAIVSLEFNLTALQSRREVTMDMPKSGGLMAGSFAISIPEGGLYLRWRFPQREIRWLRPVREGSPSGT